MKPSAGGKGRGNINTNNVGGKKDPQRKKVFNGGRE